MSQRLILLGPPGAGKGTQAVKIAQHFKIPHISTGDMMRAAVAAQSKLGLEVKRYMDSGELVPDTVVLGIMEDRLRLDDCKPGFLSDGFPRTVAQAEGLAAILKKLDCALTSVVHLVVDDKAVVERILKRGKDSGRSDDTAEVAQKRLDVYKAQTAPLIDFYAKAGLLKNVDGVGSIDEIFQRVIEVVS